MLNRLQKPVDDKDKGFTLVELLVVIVIIGILAGIAIPLFLSQRQKGVEAGIKSDLKNAATFMETEFVDEQEYPTALTGFNPTDGNVIEISSVAVPGGFCLDGSNPDADNDFFYNSATGGLGEGTCATPVVD